MSKVQIALPEEVEAGAVAEEAPAGAVAEEAPAGAAAEEAPVKISEKKMKKLMEGKLKTGLESALTDEEKEYQKAMKVYKKEVKKCKKEGKPPPKAPKPPEKNVVVETDIPDMFDEAAASPPPPPEKGGKKGKGKKAKGKKEDAGEAETKEKPKKEEKKSKKSSEIVAGSQAAVEGGVSKSKVASKTSKVEMKKKDKKEKGADEGGKKKKKGKKEKGAGDKPEKPKKGVTHTTSQGDAQQEGRPKSVSISTGGAAGRSDLNVEKSGLVIEKRRSTRSGVKVGIHPSVISSSTMDGYSRGSLYHSSTFSSSEFLSSSSSSSSEQPVVVKKPAKGKKKGKKGVKIVKEQHATAATTEEAGADAEPPAKKKKGKKDKKDKKTEVVSSEGEPPTTAEKSLVEKEEASELPTEGAEDEGGKKKKGKKKGGGRGRRGPKLTEKELQRLQQQQAKDAEEEAVRLLEEERLRLIEERKLMIVKEKREVIEQQLRLDNLDHAMAQIDAMRKTAWRSYLKDKEDEEWINYLVCDGLPIPCNVAAMNTYLDVWREEIETVSADQSAHRTSETYKLLKDLQVLIDDPIDASERTQLDWLWIRSMFRECQKNNLDYCTYRLMRDVRNRMNRIDIPTADFRVQKDNFSLCIWLLVQLPVPVDNPRAPVKPRISMSWPEMSMDVVFPISLVCNKLALRAVYVSYDHLSDTSASFHLPPLPEELNKGLIEVITHEWYEKMLYKYERRVIVPRPPQEVEQEDGTIVLVDPEPVPDLAPGEMPPEVPYQRLEPTASEYTIGLESKRLKSAATDLHTQVNEGVINLRKFFVLGGVYQLDLLVQPLQPQGMVSFEVFTSGLVLPLRLDHEPFYVEYIPPPPVAPGVRREPEEIEEELRQQEIEMDKLIFITLELPQHVFYLDVPIVCHWDEKFKEWHTRDVHDFKHIEEKGIVSFRTGKFGPFAIATYRFPNLPFQAWEIRPEADGTVSFQITAAILTIEFHIKEHHVCIAQLQNAPSKALDMHIGVYYKLPRLKRIMLDCGVDFFPTFDSVDYIQGTSLKHWAMEQHLYNTLAMSCTCYNYTWSRWNMTADYRGIVMQMRLYKFNRPKQANYSMLLVTPLKAVLVDCTEVSQTFSTNAADGMKFYADVNHLLRGISPMATKAKMAEAPQEMLTTLADLFAETRFLSFS